MLTHRNCVNQPGITFKNMKITDLLIKLKGEQKKLKLVSTHSYNGIVI